MIHMPQFLNQDSRTNPSTGGEITIGTNTLNTVYQPAYYLYKYGYSGILIPSSLIGGSYTFNKLAFYYELDDDPYPPVTPNITNQTLILAHTTSSSFSSNSESLSAASPFNVTTVKSNFSVSFSGGDGWREYSFDTNFSYNNSYNLIIKWENRWGDFDFGYPSIRYTNYGLSSTDIHIQGYQDSSYPTGTGATYKLENNNMPNTKLFYV